VLSPLPRLGTSRAPGPAGAISVTPVTQVGAGYAVTIRTEVPPAPDAVGRLTVAVGRAGAIVTALDVVESHPDRIVVDLTCMVRDPGHMAAVTAAIAAADAGVVRKASDRTFLLHIGGKIEVSSKLALRTREELSMAYTPGVARVCLAIAAHVEDARRLTIKRNTVAVVTDGSAVLGLGNLGPAAALPVMEGKAALFKRFGGVDAWPVCLDTQDTDEIVRTVQILAPVYGGINLEDISAPRCFEIERRLRQSLDIPVFHDDQHGTAIVVLAALMNALRVVRKRLEEARVVLVGAGAAGTAIIRLLVDQNVGDLIACDRAGAIHAGMAGMPPEWEWIAAHTNRSGCSTGVGDALKGADVVIGVSGPGAIDGRDLESMAPDAIVFALANPEPEVDPAVAQETAAVVATGRSDLPNQINNVLAFPGFFRGLLDAQASEITTGMSVAAARAIASVVEDDQLNASYIVPSVFDARVAPAVAAAVQAAARPRPEQER
jgi:malate dehydrogenase (oxaloacetate-decarboxylating)